ncbi:MAG TPA: hypothetical protein VM029_07720 [Opitutaceae bacterium]|nr:hypothetical protein [Opitutaceae bacterium]
MTEHEQLTQLCQRLGAPPAQAGVMAIQLLKRAEQLALERGTTREAALSRLLELVVQGRAGEVPAEFSAPPKKPGAGDTENTQRRE